MGKWWNLSLWELVCGERRVRNMVMGALSTLFKSKTNFVLGIDKLLKDPYLGGMGAAFSLLTFSAHFPCSL